MSNTLYYLLPLCLQTALLIQFWEVFDLAVLLTSFFVDTRPDVQVHTHIATPASGGWRGRTEDRVGAPARTEGSVGPYADGFPLACLGNWGFIVCYLHAVLTGHTLKALLFPSEEGGWKMRTWKFCPSLLFLSLRMLCFRRMSDCTIVESCPA